MPEPDEPGVPGAVRLIFSYDGDDIQLVSQHRVDVAVPGFDLAPDVRPGHYVELRDAAGGALNRVPVRTAFGASVEVFPEDHEEPISRVESVDRRGAFTVVVPAPAAADRVAVIRVAAPDPAAPVQPGARGTSPTPGEPGVTDLATFPLDRER